MVLWLKNLIDYGIRLQIIQLYFTIFVPLCIVIYFELNFIKPDKKITWNFTIVLFTTCTSLSRLYLLFFWTPSNAVIKVYPAMFWCTVCIPFLLPWFILRAFTHLSMSLYFSLWISYFPFSTFRCSYKRTKFCFENIKNIC